MNTLAPKDFEEEIAIISERLTAAVVEAQDAYPRLAVLLEERRLAVESARKKDCASRRSVCDEAIAALGIWRTLRSF